MTVIKGTALNSGDMIGVIALSSPVRADRVKAGVELLKSMGYRVRIALDPSGQFGRKDYLFSSASAKERADALIGLYKDPEVKAIIVARGGYGTIEVLPHLDYDVVAANPKPLIGYSDTTVALLAIYARSAVVGIHGPALESWGRDPLNPETRRSLEVLFSCLCGAELAKFGDDSLELLMGSGVNSGPLIGGNLSMIASLLGTPWDPVFDGHVLFLEEVGEAPYRVHRMLMQLKLAGKLAALKGVVFGCLRNCEHSRGLGPDIKEVLQDIFREFSYPVLTGAPFGHQALNFSMPLGIVVQISENALEFREVAVLS